MTGTLPSPQHSAEIEWLHAISVEIASLQELAPPDLSNREIATRTRLSEYTVKGYLEEILERLGAIEWAGSPRHGYGRCA